VLLDVPSGQEFELGERVERVKEELRLLFSRDLPAQDLPAEVVDDGVQVGFRPIEQLDEGDVEVPDIVRGGRADTDPWCLGVDADPRPLPAALADQLAPGGDGRVGARVGTPEART
jgi:hypothetical protein